MPSLYTEKIMISKLELQQANFGSTVGWIFYKFESIIRADQRADIHQLVEREINVIRGDQHDTEPTSTQMGKKKSRSRLTL
jgi:hypothetical protein